uniref:peptidoglycan DD-metalloendopeptidase family protein n=1 Tax=uncultured Thiodictyon sp. TaxID=1846217 RepID=UPI0025FD6471
GPTGISMVGKYLLFGLWIQLWQPILAIINLYIIMAVKFKMDALQDVALGNTPMPSILAIWKLDFILSDYLGVGGMLAASTPAISLMLIYGSAITATHLAGRLQSGDHINEKIASPDAVNPAAALNMQPIMNHGPLSGTVAPGAEQQSWSVNVGQEVQRDLRSSQQAMQRSSSGFSSALGSAASTTATKSGESFDSHASTWLKDGGKSQTDSVLMATAEGLTQKYSESGMSSTQMGAVIAGSLGGGKGKADIGATLKSQYGVDSKLADSMASDISEKVTSDQSLQARVAEGLKVDAQTGERNVFTAGLDSRESSQLTQSADDVLSASRSLDHAESQSERFGTMGSYNGIAAGAGLVRPEHQGLNEKLDRTIASYNLDGDRDDAAQRLLVGGVTADPDQARAIAGMGLLLGHTDGPRARGMTAAERAGAKEAGMEILASEFNFQAPQGISPSRNTDLSSSVPGFGGTQSQVEDAVLRDIRPEAAGLAGQVSAHGDATHQAWSAGAVDRFAQGARNEVAASAGHAQGALRSDKQSRLGAIIEQHAALPRTAAQVAQNEAGGLLAQAAETVALAGAGVGGVASQTVAGAQAFAGALRDGQGIGAAVQAGRAAAGSEAGWTGARDAMVDARMNQVSSYGLTPAQEQLYRASTETVIAGMPSDAQQAAHQAVIAESGSSRRGEQIAELIERSASTRDDTDLRLIGAFNEQTQPPEKKSPEPGLRSQSLGSTGGEQGQGANVALSSPVTNPSQYPITSGFSEHRVNPVSGQVRPHRGVDLAMPEGTPVYAAADGIARTGVQEHGAGNYISMDHGGDAGTRYMHLSRVAVQEGQAVHRGDVIGYSGDTGGSTGPHLHFEVWRNGEAVDPMQDPLTHLREPGHPGQEAPAVTAAPSRPAAGGNDAGVHQAPIVAPAPLRGMFAETEARHHLPPGMLTALASVESHFNPTAVSDAGAQGMFQITPATAADYHVSNPFDPREAAEGAATKLATDYGKFGNWEHAVLAYNAGTDRIDDYLAGRGKPLKQETVDYLPKVLHAFQHVDRGA